MILVFDVGNTNIVIARHDGNAWVKNERFRTKDADVLKQVRDSLANSEFEDSVISSVVPSLTSRISDIAKAVTGKEPLLVSRNIKTGFDSNSIPVELGADIICNLIAAHNLFPDKVATVADFGTAFTTETISAEGKVLGVTIAPGIMTSVKALHENTAQIPQICLDIPTTVLAKDTVSAIRAGVYYGFCGQLSGVLERIEMETGVKPQVLVTGGFSKYIKSLMNFDAFCDINLTIEGARLALLFNR